MTLLLKQIFNLIRMLHSENGTTQIAWGLTLGAFLGFSPFFSLQTFLILLILLIFKVQFGAAFLSAFFFKFIAFLIDPAADHLGRIVLELSNLRPFWTALYNMPIIPYTRFNNSIVMGSFVFALIISPVLYFGFQFLIKKYRLVVVERFEKSKAWKAFKATKFYEWYMKYDDLYGQHS
jgi:uncharacterized protein (TIGR03546 family)